MQLPSVLSEGGLEGASVPLLTKKKDCPCTPAGPKQRLHRALLWAVAVAKVCNILIDKCMCIGVRQSTTPPHASSRTRRNGGGSVPPNGKPSAIRERVSGTSYARCAHRGCARTMLMRGQTSTNTTLYPQHHKAFQDSTSALPKPPRHFGGL